MKQVVSRIAYSIIALMVTISSCKKDPVIEKPGGGNPCPIPPKNAFRILIDALPGQSTPANNLFAIFSVSNAQNQTVIKDRKMFLTYNGKYITDTTALFGGEYKLTKFLIADANNKTVFATPLTGSQKAAGVQTPLSISFSPKPEIGMVPLQVLPVAAGDKPEDFGYPTGSFNNPAGETPNDQNPFYKIKVHPVIKIGDVVYDSIPVSFNLRTWDAAGQMLNQFSSLKAGVNEVSLPKSAAKYLLIVSKWGITDELPLEQKDIQEGTVYTLGGSKAAKKLKSEVSLKLVDGVYKPISKDAYEYDANGRLSQIIHYLKKPDNTNYITATDKFSYNGINKVASIIKYGENNNLLSQISFSYDQQGKVVAMVQKEGGHQTDATVDYFFLNGQSGLSGDHGITINYKYSEFYYTMRYSMSFRGGVNVEDAANTSHHNAELGRYGYDFNINPYVHLNWPDLFLSHQSKHNIMVQQKQYSGAYPQSIPYDFIYKYDNEGYPVEVVKNYYSYFGGVYLYKIKTVYTY